MIDSRETDRNAPVTSKRGARRRLGFERRERVPFYWPVLTPVFSIALSLLTAAAVVYLVGASPRQTLLAMFMGAFGDHFGWEDTLIKAIPLMLAGLGVLFAFHMQWWNIGAEGQLYVGALAASSVALFIPGLPAPVLIATMILVGFVGGGLWASVAGFFDAYLNMNAIFSTLMLNYVAIAGTDYLIYGPWADPEAKGYPMSVDFANAAWLPTWPGTRIHLGLLMAVVAAGLIHVILTRTSWGHEIQVIGRSPAAARYSGINIRRSILLVSFLSGGLAGLCGMAEVAGVIHKVEHGLSPGYGFTAIIVAWLARLNPWALLPVAIFFAGLLVGGDQIQITMGLPASIGTILQGMTLFFLISGEMIMRYRLRVVIVS